MSDFANLREAYRKLLEEHEALKREIEELRKQKGQKAKK